MWMWTCYTFTEDSHNTGNFMPYSFRIVCGSFNVPRNCEHSRVVRRGLRFIVLIREDLKVLTICSMANRCSTNWATGQRSMPSHALEEPKSRTQATGRSFTYVAVKTWKKLDCWQRSSVLRDSHTDVPFTHDILSYHGFYTQIFLSCCEPLIRPLSCYG